jgi:arginine utilization protein RocB
MLLMQDAAAHLGVSVRTLERAIERGEYQVQHDDRGRRMVDMTAVVARHSADAAALMQAGEQARGQAQALAEALQHMAASHQEQVQALTHHLACEREQAQAARGEAARASEDAAGARREAQGLRLSLRRRGWVALAAALALAGVCVSLTHTHWRAESAALEVRQVRDRMTHLQAEVARQQALAEAAGQLAERERVLRVAAEAAQGATQPDYVTHTLVRQPLTDAGAP